MPKMQGVVIIDYGVGNLTSVQNALGMLGVEASITNDHQVIQNSAHLILPGVGSFGEGMEGLEKRGLIELLHTEVLEKQKKILGICLGMQLLGTKGFEFGEHEGLGFIPGRVIKIETQKTGDRLPHMGWNDVSLRKGFTISAGFAHTPIFYFVHSYHFVPEDSGVIAGTTTYGDGNIVSLVEKGNILGAQFHPEKSHDDGLQIFRNFLAE